MGAEGVTDDGSDRCLSIAPFWALRLWLRAAIRVTLKVGLGWRIPFSPSPPLWVLGVRSRSADLPYVHLRRAQHWRAHVRRSNSRTHPCWRRRTHAPIDTWPELACLVAGSNLTPEEWATYMPLDEPYRRTCPQFADGKALEAVDILGLQG